MRAAPRNGSQLFGVAHGRYRRHEIFLAGPAPQLRLSISQLADSTRHGRSYPAELHGASGQLLLVASVSRDPGPPSNACKPVTSGRPRSHRVGGTTLQAHTPTRGWGVPAS